MLEALTSLEIFPFVDWQEAKLKHVLQIIANSFFNSATLTSTHLTP
jgi:hypothetical protein